MELIVPAIDAVLPKAQTIDGWMGRRSDPTRCRGWSLPPTLRPDALRCSHTLYLKRGDRQM